MESMKSFAERVELATGMHLSQMPTIFVAPGDSRRPPGAIFACRGNVLVVATGYPDVNEHGEETWPPQAFRRYVIKGSRAR